MRPTLVSNCCASGEKRFRSESLRPRNLSLVLLAVAALAGAVLVWLVRDRQSEPSAHETPGSTARDGGRPRGVDVETYRASVRERIARAKGLAGRQRAARAAAVAARSDAGVSAGGVGPKPRFDARSMMEPECILGPAELCKILDEPVAACDEGDAQACLAVGQYLADTPPRPLIAAAFFLYACKAGEEEGCARNRAIQEQQLVPCADDPFLCAWVAYKAKDPVGLAEACAHGVADACVWFIDAQRDPARARAYLESGCQLGSPMACAELGRRLTPGCKPTPEAPCYPPDPAEAAEARAIACEAGFRDACT